MRLRPKSCPFRSHPLPSFVILFIAIFYLCINFVHHSWTRTGEKERGVIHWDVISYYSYLPATFIYGDVTLEFLDNPEPGFINDNKFWPSILENGNKLIITSMGLSVLYAPFFFMAHLLAPLFGEARDGFGSIYQLFLVLSALFYVLLGLVVLKNILLKFFRPLTIAITLLAVALGTNLFYYATFEAAMAHAYNFFLIILFLHMVIRWYEKPDVTRTALTGALFGFIALVRPTNILVLFLLVLWDVKSWNEFTARVGFFLRRFHLVLLMLALFFMVWIPQFLYWKAITGCYIFFSYAAEEGSFYFAHPHIIESLFGFKKGWFVYTPMMLLAVGGIILLRKRVPRFFLPVLIYVFAMIYVQSSWWSWWFGGGFGLRAYIDMYGILAIPFAVVVEEVQINPRRWLKNLTLSLIGLLIIFQWINTHQYRQNIIHFVGMNRSVYWNAFLKFRYPPDHWSLLTMPDYDLARKGIYVTYFTGSQYDWIAELEKPEGLEAVKKIVLGDRQLMKEIGWYTRREGKDWELVISEVVERMYFSMTN